MYYWVKKETFTISPENQNKQLWAVIFSYESWYPYDAQKMLGRRLGSSLHENYCTQGNHEYIIYSRDPSIAFSVILQAAWTQPQETPGI